MMTSKAFIRLPIACATLLGVALLGQDQAPAGPPGSLDLTGIPAPRGIYYHSNGRWMALSSTILMPFAEGKAISLEILNVGTDHTVAELPGPHAGTQIGSDARPVFFLHGINPSDLYLVHAVSRADYRELRMPVSRHFEEWAHFRPKDVADVDVVDVNGDVVAIKPRADLKPGEYALAVGVQPGDRWLRLGFDFGIAGGR